MLKYTNSSLLIVPSVAKTLKRMFADCIYVKLLQSGHPISFVGQNHLDGISPLAVSWLRQIVFGYYPSSLEESFEDFRTEKLLFGDIELWMRTPQWFVQVLRECSDGNLSGPLSPQGEFLPVDDEFLGYKEKLVAGLHLLEKELPELALEVKEVLDAIAFTKNASFVASSSLSRGLLVFLQPNLSWNYLNFLFEVIHEETHLLLDLLYLVLPPLTTKENNLFYLANLQNVVVYARLFLVVKDLLSKAYSFSASDGSFLSGVLEEFWGQVQHFYKLLYSSGEPPLTKFWSDFVTAWVVPILKGDDPVFNIKEHFYFTSWSLREIDVNGISWDRR